MTHPSKGHADGFHGTSPSRVYCLTISTLFSLPLFVYMMGLVGSTFHTPSTINLTCHDSSCHRKTFGSEPHSNSDSDTSTTLARTKQMSMPHCRLVTVTMCLELRHHCHSGETDRHTGSTLVPMPLSCCGPCSSPSDPAALGSVQGAGQRVSPRTAQDRVRAWWQTHQPRTWRASSAQARGA